MGTQRNRVYHGEHFGYCSDLVVVINLVVVMLELFGKQGLHVGEDQLFEKALRG